MTGKQIYAQNVTLRQNKNLASRHASASRQTLLSSFSDGSVYSPQTVLFHRTERHSGTMFNREG